MLAKLRVGVPGVVNAEAYARIDAAIVNFIFTNIEVFYVRIWEVNKYVARVTNG